MQPVRFGTKFILPPQARGMGYALESQLKDKGIEVAYEASAYRQDHPNLHIFTNTLSGQHVDRLNELRAVGETIQGLTEWNNSMWFIY